MKTARFYYKNNLIQQLRGFYYVAKLKSFTKASKEMGLVQSAISIQIKNLQQDLGVKLIESKNGKIHLTEVGVSFYNKIFPIVEQTNNLLKEFWQDYSEEDKNELKIGCHSVIASHFLPNTMMRLLKELPQTKIKLSHITKADAFERLINEELDIAIYPCSIYETFPVELEARPFLDCKICITIPKENPLAFVEDGKITLNDIIKYDILYEDEKLMTSSKIINIFKENNIKSVIEFENISWEIMGNLSIAGIGIAGFDEIYCKNIKDEKVVIKSIAHLLPEMKYFFVTRKNEIEKKNTSLLKELITSSTFFSA